MFKNGWCLVFDNQDSSDFYSQDWLVFDSCWSLTIYFRSVPSSMFYAFCFHFPSTLHPVWIHFASCLLPASCGLLCGWDCFHVLMTNHHMPVSNMFHSTNTNIICCYCFEFCHHLPLPMYWPLGSDSFFSYPVLVNSDAWQPDEQAIQRGDVINKLLGKRTNSLHRARSKVMV